MTNEKIPIGRSPSADTRSADHMITREELLLSTRMHISDVARAMRRIADMLVERARSHDFTKLTEFDAFWEQFHRAQETGEWGAGWYDDVHVVRERHHLDDWCPENVDLVDVIEMLCDRVMAGVARNGEYVHSDPDPWMLVKAYYNTATMLADMVELVDMDSTVSPAVEAHEDAPAELSAGAGEKKKEEK